MCAFLNIDLGIESRSLTEESASNEPETVGDGELILDHVAFGVARVRVVPLVRREARHDKEGETDEDVGRHDVKPNLHGQWVHKGKEARRLAGRDLFATLEYPINIVRIQAFVILIQFETKAAAALLVNIT